MTHMIDCSTCDYRSDLRSDFIDTEHYGRLCWACWKVACEQDATLALELAE